MARYRQSGVRAVPQSRSPAVPATEMPSAGLRRAAISGHCMLPRMDLNGVAAIVSGGASGLGEATVRDLAAAGCQVVVADLNEDRGKAVAESVGGVFASTDVSSEESVAAAVAGAEALGVPLRVAVSCAGIGWATRTVDRNGNPHPLAPYRKVID